MVVEQGLALHVVTEEHAESQLGRIALLVELAVVVAAQALEPSPMWEQDKGRTYRRPPTSMSAAVEISMQCAPGEISLA